MQRSFKENVSASLPIWLALIFKEGLREAEQFGNKSNKFFGNILTGLALITQANEIASKASLSEGYKWPLIRDEPLEFIERKLWNIALINLGSGFSTFVFKHPLILLFFHCIPK